MLSSAQGPAELGHALTALGVLPGHTEDRMPVAVEGDRAAMGLEIALESLEIGEGALRGHEAQLHEPAGGIVDEDEQRAGLGAVLEPAMLAAVDLDQLAQGLAAQPGLMEASALLAGEPQARLDHPCAQRLAADLEPVLLEELLGRERRAEVGIGGAHQLDRLVPHLIRQPVVRRPATGLVCDGAGATQAVGLHEPVHLPGAESQHCCCRGNGAPAVGHLAQHLDPLQVPLAHHHPAQARSPSPCAWPGRLTFLLCSGVTL